MNTHIRPSEFVPAAKAIIGDRFAGDWPDTEETPARMMFAVKDLTAEEGRRIRSLLSTEGQALLSLVQVKYSLSELLTFEKPIIALLRAANDRGHISGYSVRRDRRSNRVLVSLRTASDALLLQLRGAAPEDALDVVVDPRVGSKARNG